MKASEGFIGKLVQGIQGKIFEGDPFIKKGYIAGIDVNTIGEVIFLIQWIGNEGTLGCHPGNLEDLSDD
jgi:hypothetical protein